MFYSYILLLCSTLRSPKAEREVVQVPQSLLGCQLYLEALLSTI
jgi:hypothetical protein